MDVGSVVIMIGAILIICCTLILIRNDRVYAYRMRLVSSIYIRNMRVLATVDIRDDFNKFQEDLDKFRAVSDKLHKEFRSVSYNTMVFKFWRSFDSFYSPEFLAKVRGNDD